MLFPTRGPHYGTRPVSESGPRRQLANVPDAVPKGVPYEDFLSVADDVAVTVSPSNAGTISSTVVMPIKSTEEEEDVASESRPTLNELPSAVDVLRQYFFDIEGHGFGGCKQCLV